MSPRVVSSVQTFSHGTPETIWKTQVYASKRRAEGQSSSRYLAFSAGERGGADMLAQHLHPRGTCISACQHSMYSEAHQIIKPLPICGKCLQEKPLELQLWLTALSLLTGSVSKSRLQTLPSSPRTSGQHFPPDLSQGLLG